MSNLPYANLEDAGPELRKALERLPRVSSIVKMLANAETLLDPVMTLIMTIMKDISLPPRARELVILSVAASEHGRYEWAQHVPIARSVGVSASLIEQIEAGEIVSDALSAADAILLKFVEELRRDARGSAETLEQMKAHFTDRQIIEVVIVTSAYMMLVRLTETTDVDIEPALSPDAINRLAQAG